MSCNVSVFINEVKVICGEVDIVEICSLLCSKYLFVKNNEEKNFVIGEITSSINSTEVCKIVRYILNINIIIEEENMIFTQWIIINGFIKRKEYVLKSKNGNELIFLKDHNPIKISELTK